MKIKLTTLLSMAALFFASCGGEKKEEQKQENKDETKTVEKDETPAYAYTYEVIEKDMPGGWMITITTENMTFDKISETLDANYGMIFDLLMKAKKEMGVPFAIYHNWMDESSPFTMEAGIPVTDSTIKVKKPMVLRKSYKGKVVSVVYFGAYEKTKKAYEDIEQYMTENKLSANGSPWEEYITDPGVEKDTTKWQTNIYFPVK